MTTPLWNKCKKPLAISTVMVFFLGTGSAYAAPTSPSHLSHPQTISAVRPTQAIVDQPTTSAAEISDLSPPSDDEYQTNGNSLDSGLDFINNILDSVNQPDEDAIVADTSEKSLDPISFDSELEHILQDTRSTATAFEAGSEIANYQSFDNQLDSEVVGDFLVTPSLPACAYGYDNSGGGKLSVFASGCTVSTAIITSSDRLVIDTDANREVSLTLHNLDIDLASGGVEAPPIEIIGSGTATLLLSGENTAKTLRDADTAGGSAGVQVGEEASLVITSAEGANSNEGSLTAMSHWGSGIGGGWRESGSNITITGGTIDASSHWGAGIGGGRSGDGTNITITGGTIDATSTFYGAGIGGGHTGVGSNITITGGTVKATSTGFGAGIGGGWQEVGSNITVAGGTVSAVSNFGAGIGGAFLQPGLDNVVSGTWGNPTILVAKSTSGAAAQGFSTPDRYAFRTQENADFVVASAGDLSTSGGFLEVRTAVGAISWNPGNDGTWTQEAPPPAVCIPGIPVAAPDADAAQSLESGNLFGWQIIGAGIVDEIIIQPGANVCAQLPEGFTGNEVTAVAIYEAARHLAFPASPSPIFGRDGTWTLNPDSNQVETSYTVEMVVDLEKTTTNRLVIDTGNSADNIVNVTLNNVSIDFTTSDADNPPIEIIGVGTAILKLVGTNTATTKQNGSSAGVQVGEDAKLTITSANGIGSATGSLTATSSGSGAGIGGGRGVPGTNITIAGGIVTATSHSGAGIGGGRDSSGPSNNSIVSSENPDAPTRVVASSAEGLAIEGFTNPVTAAPGHLVQVWNTPTSTLGSLHDSWEPDDSESPVGGFVRAYIPVVAYAVTYDLAGGTWDRDPESLGVPDRVSRWDQVTIPNPVPPADHGFTGWEQTGSPAGMFGYLASNLAALDGHLLENVTSPVTLTARYQRTRPTITAANLPPGVVGHQYAAELEATGDGAIGWEITAGNLPPGLTLDTGTRQITGTPTDPGSYAFTVTTSDDNGTNSHEFEITINPVPVPPPVPNPPPETGPGSVPNPPPATNPDTVPNPEPNPPPDTGPGSVPNPPPATNPGAVPKPGGSLWSTIATGNNGQAQNNAPEFSPRGAAAGIGSALGSLATTKKQAPNRSSELSPTGTTAGIWAVLALLAATAGILCERRERKANNQDPH